MGTTERWKPLDLRRRGELGPYDGELIVLHMVPKTSARSERYVVGRLEVVAGRTWMSGGGNTLSPARCVSDMTSGGSGCQRTIPGRIRKDMIGGDGTWPI